jgi:signal recognition particle receptor subunit beta
MADTLAPEPLAKPTTLEQFLARQERIGLLRFLTCGSVDDGKSTLIGRLLYDTKLIFDDTLAALERDSARHGTTGEDIDFALLVDGLEAEREQGITIDVAYRFFTTDKRRFIVADTPGHEQYTRNMATGASNAELAVVLVDARQGVLTQTKRHSFIVSLHRPRRLLRGAVQPDPRRVCLGRSPSRLRHADRDPDFCPLRRQRHLRQRPHTLVRWPEPARTARNH